LPTVRIVGLAVAWAFYDVLGLLGLLGLWLASGAGLGLRSVRVQEAHYGLMRFWIGGVSLAARRLFRLRIRIEDPPERRAGPVLVFSRHAGPGNSLMLLGVLMLGYQRRPRIVMLEKLQFEPFFDVIGNRVPNRFIRHDPARRERTLQEIAGLAAGMGQADAFVLFPEGKDFTPTLRRRAIASLRRRGHEDRAQRAELMERVLPPRSSGVMAALGAAPEADVVFVAHTVLEDIGSFRDLRRRGPLDRPVLARYWRIPAAEVPREKAVLVPWLYEWWARIDAWIDARTGTQASAQTGAQASAQASAQTEGSDRQPPAGSVRAPEPEPGIGDRPSA